ncbi:MAG: hypothetical protein ABSG80_14050 [Verrucomicrobiota bacterium]|jgi:hypothetical protein
MNSKELFTLFLRIVGILGVIFIVRHVLASFPACTPSVYLLIKRVVGALVALYLIRGAPLLVKFAYPAKHVICEP